MTFTAYGDNANEQLKQVSKKICELERLWSVADENSEIYAVNHSNGITMTVSDETADLLNFTLNISDITDGALEPSIYHVLSAWGFTTGENRIPSDSEISQLMELVGSNKIKIDGSNVSLEKGMMLDLGSVGKGYAGDIAADMLKKSGISSALLDIGGNIQAVGSKPDGSDWRLGLRDPFSADTLGILEISDSAVVTSGNYERYFEGENGEIYGHIIDPTTGYPADSGLVSVTVIAKAGKLCDALSTSLFVMGRDKAIDFWRKSEFEMILITENREIYLTEGISDKFSPDNDIGIKVNVAAR